MQQNGTKCNKMQQNTAPTAIDMKKMQKIQWNCKTKRES